MFINLNDVLLDVFYCKVGRVTIGKKDTSEVRQTETVGEVIEDAITGSKAVDCTEEVSLFFKNVGVDGNIAYNLEFSSVVEWRVGCANWLGKGVEVRHVWRLFVEGKGDAGGGSTKYVEAGVVFDADKVAGVV